jgi:mannose-6-phosphate isomerase-like protein (cupin superfamily)
MEAVVHRPGEEERHTAGNSEIVIKATDDETAGTFFLSESTIAPGFPGPPLHHHERLVDMFYVLDGALTVRLGDQTHELEAGAFVCVPASVVHTFSNPSESPVRFLNFNTPAGW